MHYPAYSLRTVVSLDGLWDFAFPGPGDPRQIALAAVAYTDKMLVPAAFDALPAYAARRGIAVYRTHFRVPAGRRARLQFDGVGMWCAVHVDRQHLAEHSGGYSRFWVEVPAATTEERELVVVVDNQFDNERSPIQLEYYDWYQYGGITRTVQLHMLPSGPFLDAVAVETLQWRTGRVRVRARLGGCTALPALSFSVDGVPVKPANLTASGDTVTCELQVPDPRPWSPAAPNLHTLTVATPQDDTTVRFGLRQVTARACQILINDEPVKLLGFNRHESHPQFGPAQPEGLLLADLQILRRMGCNFIRGSHYPQDQRFLDLCDELGFLVWEEGCAWGQHEEHFVNPRFLSVQMQGLAEMVAASINHPSVILWGFFNEGDTRCAPARAAYTAMADRVRSLDSSRLVTFADMYPEESTVLDLADVLSINMYPGWYKGTMDDIVPRIRSVAATMRNKGGADKPYIVSEMGAAAIYGCRDDSHDVRWTEQYQAELLEIAATECVTNPAVNGLAIWQYCDGRTSDRDLRTSLTRARGFNNKGVLDEYRRPKMSAAVVSRIFNAAPATNPRPRALS